MNVLVINGPNLNLLGKREPDKYGCQTLMDIIRQLKEEAGQRARIIDFQSNHEGEIIDFIGQRGSQAQLHFNQCGFLDPFFGRHKGCFIGRGQALY